MKSDEIVANFFLARFLVQLYWTLEFFILKESTSSPGLSALVLDLGPVRALRTKRMLFEPQ